MDEVASLIFKLARENGYRIAGRLSLEDIEMRTEFNNKRSKS